MTVRRTWAFVAVLIVTQAVGAAPDDPQAAAEVKRLQGTWTLISYSADGRLLRGEDAATTLTVEDDRWTITWPKEGGAQVEQGAVKVVSTKGPLKVLDLVHNFGPYKGTTTRAFYQVEGDSLRYTTLVTPDSILDSQVSTGTTTWKRK